MISTDYHIHTHYSGDSNTPPEQAVKQAISIGLKEIAITDHLDFLDDTLVPESPVNLRKYAEEIESLQKRYAGAIIIKLGLEVGFDPGMARKLNVLTDPFPFDFIIGSSHDIDGRGIFNEDFYAGRPKAEAYGEYFDHVLRVIEARPDFSVYGHLDVIERYGRYPDKALYYDEHEEAIEAVLKALIKTGKGIEANSSGYRYSLGHATPQPLILKRYKELGGELITVGSDAHRLQDIGAGFDLTRETLLALGYRYITLFDRMKPRMVKL
ncbi:MAG: histidinol-phosphatase HisJ family protein [Clostridiales bacterium]|jgi:histidinol-phosphatase (PHP family)|nr:histidinol-phosphatase HisJ family protein [Clostridiales bacterium]